LYVNSANACNPLFEKRRWSRVASWLLPVLASTIGTAAPRLAADIIITEIHYAPVDASGAARSDLEFIELFNDSPEPIDLTGYGFAEGVFFQFTEDLRRDGRAFLGAKSYIAVCRDEAAVKAYYGIANAAGNFQGILDNAGEEIEFVNPQGARVSQVRYNDRPKWPSGAKGTGHSLSLKYEYSDNSEPESWALSSEFGGTPGRANFNTQTSFRDTIIIDSGAAWRYLKGTAAPPADWNQLGFNDAAWASGASGIGYGDGDDATVLTDMQNGYLTVFCRRTFTVNDVNAIDNLVLSVIIDDGFAAYLNGTEVASHNVGSRAFDAPATGTVDNGDLIERDISTFKNRLRNGSNVLAVQVHNVSLGSSDVSFNPRLLSREIIAPEASATVPVLINEAFLRTGGARFIELHNASASPVDLSGYFLTDDYSQLRKLQLANGSSIPARGFLHFNEAELPGLDLGFRPVVHERIAIALTNPAGQRVVDAVVFAPSIDEKSEARLPDGGAEFAPAAEPSPGAANRVNVITDVIFNEIMYNPHNSKSEDQKLREEFIELFNRGGQPVDLGGWRIDGVDLTFPAGTTIAAGAYLVVAHDVASIRAIYGLDDAVLHPTPWGGALRDGGERLDLVDPLGNIADTVRFWDGGDWPIWADGGGSSLELIDPASDNSVASSWDASDDSDKATVRTISYSNVRHGGGESDFGILLADDGIAIVDDISLMQSGGASNLISNPSFDVNNTSWRFEGTHIRSGRTTDAGERITGAGSMKLICWNGSGDYKVNRVETNTGAQSAGVTYGVTYRAKWRIGSNRILTIGDYNVGQPDNPGIAGSNRVDIPSRLGSPGEQNTVTNRQIARRGSENIGPSIDQVKHSPGVPEANEQVTVSARVSDPDSVSTVRLFYRTEAPTGAFSSVAMTSAGNGRYTGAIPGNANGVRVLFYIEATDGAGAPSRYPRDIFERSHPPVLNPASPRANDRLYLMYRHDVRVVATSKHSFRFVLNEESENELASRLVLSNQMLEGTFIFGQEDVYYNAKVRFAGSPWLRPGGGTWGKSYSLQFPEDRLLHGRKGSINLDNHGSDGRERISHYLMRYIAGSTRLPYYNFHSIVRYQLNDVLSGTYEALDKPNNEYVEFWFRDADNGPFFEMDDRFSFDDAGNRTGNADGRVQYPPYGSTGGANPENYRWFFTPRGGANKTRDEFGPFQDLCRVMDQDVTTNTAFDQQVWNVLDVEEVLRVLAIEMNIDDWDTWGGRRGKNCYFYRATDDLLWRKVPWDIELTYGDVNAFAMPASSSQTYNNFFAEITRMINRPRTKRMYYGILAEMVDPADGCFHSGWLTPLMTRLSGAGVGSTNVGTSGGFVDARANLIRGWIRDLTYPQVRLTITTNGGNAMTVNSVSVDLAGDAPADVFSLNVSRNGELVDDPGMTFEFSTSSTRGWTLRGIPLAGGANDVQVFGFNSRGELIDTDGIAITSTVSWNPPQITAVQPDQAAGDDEIVLVGSDFHNGLRVIFDGGTQAAVVVFDEAVDASRIRVRVPSSLPAGPTTVVVRNLDGKDSPPAAFTVIPPAPKFIRGDANLDGRLDLSDGVKVLRHLFAAVAVGCADAADADDSGSVNVTDAVRVLDYLFRDGPPLPPPFPSAGTDPTSGDPLDCGQGLPGGS
jgi:hypothetical protein